MATHAAPQVGRAQEAEDAAAIPAGMMIGAVLALDVALRTEWTSLDRSKVLANERPGVPRCDVLAVGHHLVRDDMLAPSTCVSAFHGMPNMRN